MKKIVLFFALVSCLVACNNNNNNSVNVKIHRYDKDFFNINDDKFSEELKNLQSEYIPFLSGDLNNSELITFFHEFYIDSAARLLYQRVQEDPLLNDDAFIAQEVGEVFYEYQKTFPEKSLPQVYTWISGVDSRISPVMLLPDENGLIDALLISLDFYLGANDSIYNFYGLPLYISMRFDSRYLKRDIAEALVQQHLGNVSPSRDLLSEMIETGKKLFIINSLCKDLELGQLLRYTPEQTTWVKSHETDIWEALVGEEMLYSSNFQLRKQFFAEGPFTAAFSNSAPPRLGEYVGFKIVESFMSHNACTIKELIDKKDYHELFQQSQYKP